MKFSDKLVRLRKSRGYSQEQLADALGVTRQSVSKWESDQAMPELSKLILLSDMFDVSVDRLIKENMQIKQISEEKACLFHEENNEVSKKLEELTQYVKGYAYTSKKRIAGIPLISIRFSSHSLKGGVAKGWIAIGNIAVGVVSIGAVSLGFLSMGAFSAGLLALGAVAVGAMAFGAAAIGIIAGGTAAVGVYSWGVAAMGWKIAVGVAAGGETAIAKEAAEGTHTLLVNKETTENHVREFILQAHPRIWKPFLNILVKLAKLLT